MEFDETFTHHCAVIPHKTQDCQYSYDNCPDRDTVHKGFIPVPEFKRTFLDASLDRYSDFEKEYMEVMIDCTVKITVKYISHKRPDTFPRVKFPYPFIEMRGRKEIVLCGTGYIPYYSIEKTEGKPCPCHECTASDNARIFWSIPVATATHVVFDINEAKSAVVELFFDTEDRNGVKYLYGINVIGDSSRRYETDSCVMMCVTHDSELVDRLSQLLDRKRIYLGRNTPTGIMVSHPHGVSKMVSLGAVDQKCFIPNSDSLLESLLKYDVDFIIDDKSEGFLRPERIYNSEIKNEFLNLLSKNHVSFFYGKDSSLKLDLVIGLLILNNPDNSNNQLSYKVITLKRNINQKFDKTYLVLNHDHLDENKTFFPHLDSQRFYKDILEATREELDNCRAFLYVPFQLPLALYSYTHSMTLFHGIWDHTAKSIYPFFLLLIMHIHWTTTRLADIALFLVKTFPNALTKFCTILVFKDFIAAIPLEPKLLLRRHFFGDKSFWGEISQDTVFICRKGNNLESKMGKLAFIIPQEVEKNICVDTYYLISYSISACPGSSGAKVYPQHCPTDCEENLYDHAHHCCRDPERFYSGQVECGFMSMSELKEKRIKIV